jgi:tetratricopeptide (TPR) repeat protein
VLAVLIWGATAGSAFAQWYRTYEEGQQALQKKQWSVAKDKLEAAIAEAQKAGRKPGRSVLWYGSLRQPFLPNYLLGQAYMGLAADEKDPEKRKQYYTEATNAFAQASPAEVRATDPENAQIASAQKIILTALGTGIGTTSGGGGGGDGGGGGGEKTVVDPALASARQQVQQLVTDGDRALASSSWDAATAAFTKARDVLAEHTSLRGEFNQLDARNAEAAFAVNVAAARQALADARFAAAVEALERLTPQANALQPSSPTVRTLVAGLERDLKEARAGQALVAADDAFRERRWDAAGQEYGRAQTLADGVTFTSRRGRDLLAQVPARLKETQLNGALAARRYLDALAIDPANRVAIDGQYALAMAAYNDGRWDEAVAAFDGLLKYANSYRDARDRWAAASMQVASASGVAADATDVRAARQFYDRVLALRQQIKGSLADSPIVVRATEQAADRVRHIEGQQGLEAARALYRSGDWTKARDAVNVVLRLLPGDEEALKFQTELNDSAKEQRVKTLETQAKDAAGRGDVAGATSAAEALRKLVPGSETAGAVLAQVTAIRTGRTRRYQQIAAATGVALIGPILLVFPRRRAQFLAAVGRPASAVRLYSRVLTKHPTDRTSLSRAAALSIAHNVDAPLASHFDEYLRYKPNDVRLALTAAEFFWQRGETGRAISMYEKLVASAAAELPDTVYERLEQQYRGNLSSDVVEGLRRIRAADSANSHAARLLADHYAALGASGDEALETYRIASELEPTNSRLRVSYARALLGNGSVEGALTQAGDVARLRPDDPIVLQLLAEVGSAYAASGATDLPKRLDALHLPANSLLFVREALFARTGVLRRMMPADSVPDDPAASRATLHALVAHRALDAGDLDAALAALTGDVNSEPTVAIDRKVQLDAFERYMTAASEAGRSPEPALLGRVAELYARGEWWEESIRAWQRTVSIPEWSRRSMDAIEAILDRVSIEEMTRIYFQTAGWISEPYGAEAEPGPAALRATPGSSWNAELRAQFEATPIFCYQVVVTVDDAVALKRQVLARLQASRSAMAFLVASVPIRHDVYALMYAFMTEEPSVTIVPLETRVIREAIVEARSRVHLERTLHQWLGHTDIFETHNPVSNAATFFGRGHFINQLVLKITRRQNFGIFGLRKIGKTSLVYRLRELSRDHLVAYVDLQGVASRRTEEVYSRLLESLVRDLRVKYPDIRIPVARLQESTPPEEVATAFHADVMAIHETFRLQNRPMPHVLLLLDEIELMVPFGGSPGFKGHQDFFRHIRGLYQQESFIVSAVVGATPTVCRTATWDGRDNPVFQFYDEVFLAPLDRQECDQMVQGLGELMGVRFDADSLQTVFAETAGHPYVARQLCSRLVKSFPERPLDVRADMMATAIAEYLAQRGDYFAGLVEGYLGDAARRTVETIAMADDGCETRNRILERVGTLAERHVVDQVLGDLELVGLVTRDGERYRLSMPLFRRWLRRSWLGLE